MSMTPEQQSKYREELEKQIASLVQRFETLSGWKVSRIEYKTKVSEVSVQVTPNWTP